MQPDDGGWSDWLEVQQQLRQASMLFLLLFNNFFALTVVLSKVERGYGHSRLAGAPEGTADVDGTGVSYGLRSLCGVKNAVRG